MSPVRIRVARMRTGRFVVCVTLGDMNFFKTATDEFHAGLLALELQGFCENTLKIQFEDAQEGIEAEWEEQVEIMAEGVRALNDLLTRTDRWRPVLPQVAPEFLATLTAIERLRDWLTLADAVVEEEG